MEPVKSVFMQKKNVLSCKAMENLIPFLDKYKNICIYIMKFVLMLRNIQKTVKKIQVTCYILILFNF